MTIEALALRRFLGALPLPFQFITLLASFLDLFSVSTELLHCFVNANLILLYSIAITSFYRLATCVHACKVDHKPARAAHGGGGGNYPIRKFALKGGGLINKQGVTERQCGSS